MEIHALTIKCIMLLLLWKIEREQRMGIIKTQLELEKKTFFIIYELPHYNLRCYGFFFSSYKFQDKLNNNKYNISSGCWKPNNRDKDFCVCVCVIV